MKPIVYLAGRISGLTYDKATGWRKEIVEKYSDKFDIINPMAGTESLNIKKREIHPEDNPTGENIFARDVANVLRCHLLVANVLDGVVFGTPFELGVGWTAGKDIILVVRGSEPNHPFYKCATTIVRSLKQLHQELDRYENVPGVSKPVDFSQYTGRH